MQKALVTLLVFALTGSLGIAETDRGDWRVNGDATAARSLDDVLRDCVRELKHDDKTQYVPLMTVGQIRTALDDALTHADFGLPHDPNVVSQDMERLREVITPMIRKIIDDGVVPENCSFWGFYSMGERSGLTKGFYLRLIVDSGDVKTALPVLDVAWGRVPISFTKVAQARE